MKSSSSELRDKSSKENMSTPIKLRDQSRFEDNFSGGKDTAFQLYCKQNLSPINFYPLLGIANRSPFINTPDGTKAQQSTSAKKSKFKSLFSPSGIPANYSFLESERHTSPKERITENETEDQGEQSRQIEIIQNAASEQKGKLLELELNVGTEKKEKATSNEPQIFDSASPAIKFGFATENQIDNIFESEVKRDIAEEYCFNPANNNQNPNENNATVSNSQKIYKSKEVPDSYKRVIQFQDDQEQEQFPTGFFPHENFETAFLEEGKRKICKNLNSEIKTGLQGQKINLFSQSQKNEIPQEGALLETNATTVKKTGDEIQQITLIQSTKPKRKLFDSPQSSSNKDMQTPSTKKKLTQQRINISLKQASSTSPLLIKKGDTKRKESIKEEIVQSSEEEDEDDIEEESSHKLASFMPINVIHHHEDKKICCNCKRTKCLKLYCECFAASRVCEGCTCQGCFNRPEFEAIRQEARNSILERNNSAFDPKIDKICEDGMVDHDQKAHSKGCNCKKSNCLKKYCECYQLGVKCTKLCKCDHCKNTSSSAAACYDDQDSHVMNSASANKNSKDGIRNGQTDYNSYNYYYHHPEQYYQFYYSQYGCYPYYGDYYQYGTEEYNEGEMPLQYPPDMQVPFDAYHKIGTKKKSSKHKRKPLKQETENENMTDQTKEEIINPPLEKKKKINSSYKEQNENQLEQNENCNEKMKLENEEKDEHLELKITAPKSTKPNKKPEYNNKLRDISLPPAPPRPIVLHHNLNTRSSQRLSENKVSVNSFLVEPPSDKQGTIQLLQTECKNKQLSPEVSIEEKKDENSSSKKSKKK